MLCESVRHEAKMRRPVGEPGKDGRVLTERDHLAAAVRMGRLPESALDGPDTPAELDYLLEWFHELERTRTYSMNGPDPLTYPTIEAWARLTYRNPSPDEVNALLMLDGVSRFPTAGESDG